MLKSAHPIEPEELMAYLDGELDGDRAGVAAEHLERCAECRRVAEELRGVSRSMASWEVEEYPAEPPRAKARRHWGWGWRTAAGLAVMGMALVGVRWWQTPVLQKQAASLTRPYLEYEPPVKVTPTLRSEGYTEQTGDITLRAVIRTSQLELEVRELTRAREAVESIVTRHHGYVSELSVRGGITGQLQVPAAERMEALAELRRLGRVVSETRTATDVTRQTADLEARLANTRITEQRLKEILQQRTGKLSDVLEVEQQIARVRGEIEQMESQRKEMAGQVRFVAIQVTIRQEAAGGSLGAAARSGWQNLTESLTATAVFLLSFGPTALLWAALLFLIVLLVRRWRLRQRRQ